MKPNQDGLKELIASIEDAAVFDWTDQECCVGHYANELKPDINCRINALIEILCISKKDATNLYYGKTKGGDKCFSLGITKKHCLNYLRSFLINEKQEVNELERNMLNMYSSYVSAAISCGGSPFSYESLSKMTMEEFMKIYSPNGMSFGAKITGTSGH